MSLYDQLQCLSIVSVQHRIMCAFTNYYIFISSMFRNIQGHTFMICLNCERLLNKCFHKKKKSWTGSIVSYKKKCNMKITSIHWNILYNKYTVYNIRSIQSVKKMYIFTLSFCRYTHTRSCILMHMQLMLRSNIFIYIYIISFNSLKKSGNL